MKKHLSASLVVCFIFLASFYGRAAFAIYCPLCKGEHCFFSEGGCHLTCRASSNQPIDIRGLLRANGGARFSDGEVVVAASQNIRQYSGEGLAATNQILLRNTFSGRSRLVFSGREISEIFNGLRQCFPNIANWNFLVNTSMVFAQLMIQHESALSNLSAGEKRACLYLLVAYWLLYQNPEYRGQAEQLLAATPLGTQHSSGLFQELQEVFQELVQQSGMQNGLSRLLSNESGQLLLSQGQSRLEQIGAGSMLLLNVGTSIGILSIQPVSGGRFRIIIGNHELLLDNSLKAIRLIKAFADYKYPWERIVQFTTAFLRHAVNFSWGYALGFFASIPVSAVFQEGESPLQLGHAFGMAGGSLFLTFSLTETSEVEIVDDLKDK